MEEVGRPIFPLRDQREKIANPHARLV